MIHGLGRLGLSCLGQAQFIAALIVGALLGGIEQYPLHGVQEFRLHRPDGLHILDATVEQGGTGVHHMWQCALQQTPAWNGAQCFGQRWRQAELNVLHEDLLKGLQGGKRKERKNLSE